jgi:hypothetical protein
MENNSIPYFNTLTKSWEGNFSFEFSSSFTNHLDFKFLKKVLFTFSEESIIDCYMVLGEDETYEKIAEKLKQDFIKVLKQNSNKQ